MHRLFLALKPPAGMIRRCRDAMEDGPRGWAWQNEMQLHLTLRFIGEVDRHRAQDIVDALDHLRFRPVEMEIDGVGWFDHGPRGALFARVGPKPPLEALHRKLDHMLVKLGQEPERRAFVPHITLARRRGGAESPTDWLRARADLRSEPVPGGPVILFESRLGGSGATYEAISEMHPAA